MAMNDRIADMLTRIRNGQGAHLPSVRTAHSATLQSICNVLEREGYIRGSRVEEIGNNKKDIIIELKYFEGEPAIKEIRRVSTSGRRNYSSVQKLPKVRNGLGMFVLSTSKGVISDFEARQQNVGGEVLCSVF